MRIRLADARDQERLQGLWAQGPWAEHLPPLAAVLRDPLAHVHYALGAGDEPIGLAAVYWLDVDAVEDLALVVVPPERRRGVGSQLRLAQLRDLVEMEVPDLFIPAPLDAEGWCRLYATPLATPAPDERYFWCATAEALQVLAERVPPPHPLTDETRARLCQRAQDARAALERQRAWGTRVLRRLLARAQMRGPADA
ncbi:MAG: hypothetical protein QN130_12480 [Armatimonadota bacterium]|nr:hypothetical protein [Armatimonadota bacterium]